MSGSEASFNENDATAQEVEESLRKMGKLVNNLMARADCVPFREPVDWKGLQLYDYPKIISRAMDLGTIKSNLERGGYADASECADDVRLVWRNCMTYNADGSDFYRLAESYSRRFEERYQKLADEFGEEVVRRGSLGARAGGAWPSSTGKKSRSGSFVSSGRNTPVPPGGGGASSASASKTDGGGGGTGFDAGVVPLDARARFAAKLQRLSGMELGHVLQAIDVSCPEALEDPAHDQLRSDATPAPKRHRYAWDEYDGGCQIEVDVDAIPPKTFWDLDKYVRDKVHGRGRGPWSDDLAEAELGGKKKKMKSF